MRKFAKLALAVVIICWGVSVHTIKAFRGLQPQPFASQEGSFETRWNKETRQSWRKPIGLQTDNPRRQAAGTFRERLPMVLVEEREDDRIKVIIPTWMFKD